jgi:hypothetical protein
MEEWRVVPAQPPPSSSEAIAAPPLSRLAVLQSLRKVSNDDPQVENVTVVWTVSVREWKTSLAELPTKLNPLSVLPFVTVPHATLEAAATAPAKVAVGTLVGAGVGAVGAEGWAVGVMQFDVRRTVVVEVAYAARLTPPETISPETGTALLLWL